MTLVYDRFCGHCTHQKLQREESTQGHQPIHVDRAPLCMQRGTKWPEMSHEHPWRASADEPAQEGYALHVDELQMVS